MRAAHQSVQHGNVRSTTFRASIIAQAVGEHNPKTRSSRASRSAYPSGRKRYVHQRSSDRALQEIARNRGAYERAKNRVIARMRKGTTWGSRPRPVTNSMNDRFFVDTSILVYAYDHSAGPKHAITIALLNEALQSGAAILNTPVLQELVICLTPKVARPLANKEIRKIVAELLDEWEVFVNNTESVLRWLAIEERYKLRFGMR